MTTKELLDTYFQGLMKKSGWEPLIADDFIFWGGRNMTEPPVVGKAAFIQVMNKFYPLFTAMRVKDQVVDGDRAYFLTNYDFSFPNGKKANGDVVEVWTVRDGKLASRTVFNDTHTVAQLMQ
jgi:ketosteroid isomerase-like protein